MSCWTANDKLDRATAAVVSLLPYVLLLVAASYLRLAAEGSAPGDPVYLEGQTPGRAFPKTLKSEYWKKIVAELKVHSHTACFAEQKLITDRGAVHLDSSIPDGAGIH